MSLKDILGLGKKTKEVKDITDTKDSDSVSLSYTEENNNSFESSSDNVYKPVVDNDLDDSLVDHKDILTEIEESSKADQTRGFDPLEKKSLFSFGAKNEEEDTIVDKALQKKEVVKKKNKKKRDLINDFTRDREADTPTKGFAEPRSIGSLSDASLSEASFEAKKKKLPLIGNFNLKKQYQVISAIGVVGVALISIGTFQYYTGSQDQVEAQNIILQTKSNLQKLDNTFSSATIGKSSAYQSMLSNFENVQKDFEKVKDVNKNFSRAALEKITPIEKDLNEQFSKVVENVNKVKNQADFLQNTSQRVTDIANRVNNLTEDIDRLAMIYLQSGGTQNELSNIYFMRGLLQNMASNSSNLLLSDITSVETAIDLTRSRQTFKKVMTELYYGDENRNINPVSLGVPFNTYSKVATEWILFADVVDAISSGANGLLNVRALAPQTSKIISQLDLDINKTLDIYSTDSFKAVQYGLTLISLGLLLALLSVLIIFAIYTFERDNKALEEKIENNKNQSSILKLLNEMIPLQEGDLTAHATVSNEITGAIADSVNATVDSLGSLVRKIKDTSLTMRERTNEVNIISLSMLKANEEQAVSIQDAATSIKQVSQAIRDISNKTKKSALAAESSVKASEEGSRQVFSSVQTMQVIDGTMVETDRLMKKVQDSSKQISEIVELLSDITEGTSILALNATVQAAKAGDTGKGFKIVADSIQELADNAADATRRVGALIAAVQTDIQAVGESVERAKQEVKNGVALSESAGESLNRITEISNNLSEIVREISQEAIGYAKNSDEISRDMEQLIESTQITKNSTEKTAKSITEIAGISNELGESVQSFKVE